MARYAIQFASLFFAAFATASASTEPIQILRTGLWHGNEVSAESSSEWWGIFPDGEGFTLQHAPITVSPAFDAMTDKTGEMTGKKVSIAQKRRPVVLIRGLSNPTPGPLDSVKALDRRSFLYPGETQPISLAPKNHLEQTYIAALGIVDHAPKSTYVIFREYRLLMVKGFMNDSVHQILGTFSGVSGDVGPGLVWAGDIDRDGRVDLLYNLLTNGFGERLGLFLSSAAKEGELVGLVAEWETSGHC